MKHNKNIFWLFFIVGLLTIAGCSTNSTENAAKNTQTSEDVFTGEVKEFNVIAYQWAFEPSTITVNKGDKVRITATSRDVPHGFAIDEYGINLYLDGLRPKTAEFIADKAGTFVYYCSVQCGSGHGRMRGKLIVK
jgi:cytochrome c oxidase subunit 2